MLLILIGSLLPAQPKEEPFWKEMLHNLVHVPAYAGLMFLWLRTMKFFGQTAIMVRDAFVISFVYGVMIEFLQGFVPGRDPSVLDVVLNTLGIMITIVFAKHKNYTLVN
jgi:VanZ family protein